MDLKVFLFIALLCLLKTTEVESQDFLKDAFKTVKSAVVKGYHHVAHIFVKHDHLEDEDCDGSGEEEEMKQEFMEPEITTTIVPLIDIRFKNKKEESSTEEPSSVLRRQNTNTEDDEIPDLHNRFFINAPCGDGMRRRGSGCREVINNN